MRLAILTPQRKESILLVNHLASMGMAPDLLILHRPGTGVPRKADWRHVLKSFVKRRFLFFLDSERIRRVRNSNLALAAGLIDDYAKQRGLSVETVNGVRQVEVADVNAAETVQEVRDSNIDVLFIWGIPIVRGPLLKAVHSMVVNAHSSILPEYRGSRSEFWQFHNRDFGNCGITLHRVDTGVDTGEVLMQVPARESDLVNPEILHAWNVIRVIQSFPLLLKQIQEGSLQPIDQSMMSKSRTKTYRIKDVKIDNQRKVYLGK